MRYFFILLVSTIFVLFSCSKNESVNSNTTANGIPKLIVEKDGWHVLGGQQIALTVAAMPLQLMVENGHITQFYKGMFYANPNTSTYNYARSNLQGDSMYVKQGAEYTPFFYKEGDKSDVRYGAYFQGESNHVTTGVYGIGPDALDVNTKLFDFPPFYGGYTISPGVFANPHWFVYWNKQTSGLTAYRIGTGQQIDMGGFYQNDYVILFGASAISVDETYAKANPTHLKAFFYGSNNNISVNGHSRNYLSFYTADDQNKTVFRDSTSQYIVGGAGVSCSDEKSVYYFFNNARLASNTNFNDTKLLMLVFDKNTMKITKQQLLSKNFDVIENLAFIPAKNSVFIKSNLSTKGVFRLNLTDFSITDITPILSYENSGIKANLSIATDGTKLYATVGSDYGQYNIGVTNVLVYE